MDLRSFGKAPSVEVTQSWQSIPIGIYPYGMQATSGHILSGMYVPYVGSVISRIMSHSCVYWPRGVGNFRNKNDDRIDRNNQRVPKSTIKNSSFLLYFVSGRIKVVFVYPAKIPSPPSMFEYTEKGSKNSPVSWFSSNVRAYST